MNEKIIQITSLAKLSLLDLYRRKDLIVVFILCAIILAPLAFFSPFGVQGASRQMSELALILIWGFSFFIAIAVSNRLIRPETESRTLMPLLAKPVSRGIVIFGKFCGAASASLSALVIFYIGYALMVGIKGGTWFPEVAVQAFLLHAAGIILLCAMTLFGSLVLTPSANLTISPLIAVSMLIWGGRLNVFAASQPPLPKAILTVLNWIAPHFDFFDMRLRAIHDWAAIPWSVATLVILYAAVYTAIFIFLSIVVFKRKKI